MVRRTQLFVLALCLLAVNNNTLDADEDSYQLLLAWDEPWDSPINVTNQVHGGVAGARGRVISKNGKLIFEDGSQARFWGVGLTLSDRTANPFPPEKHYAAGFARRLAKYGFNHVRIVGLDNSLPGITGEWLRSGELKSEYLDRLDFLIAKLREQGIYYSFSINNSSLYLFDDIVDGAVNNYSQPWRRFHHIRLFDPRYVQRQVSWYKAFFSHKNRYTGFTYAKDPANIYVAAVNEDSIFQAYFENYRFLTHDNKSLLYRQFSGYLKNKYEGQLALEKAWCSSRLAGIDNLGAGSVRVLLPSDLRHACRQRRVDTLEFLVSIDANFSARVHAALDEIGYRGLFTGTNNWYGYGALLATQVMGTYTDMHGYFDHPVNKKISGRSFLNRLSDPELTKDFSFPFTASEIQGVLGLPVIISEWNHAAWSPYAYEGPVLMATYASLQGYSTLDAHTWFSYPDSDLKLAIPTEGFAVGTNPVFMALSPSLSVAFVKGYIRESEESTVLPLAHNMPEFYDLILESGLSRKFGVNDYPAALIFSRKVRTTLIGNDRVISDPVVRRGLDRSIVSDTGEIQWNSRNKSDSSLVVDTTYFKAFVTGNSAVKLLSDVEIQVHQNGAITVVSLDGNPIIKSRKILITGVSGLNIDGDRTSFKRNKNADALRLQRLTGKVRLFRRHGLQEKIRASAVDANGVRRRVKLDYEPSATESGSWWVAKLGEMNSPWLLVEAE